MTPIEDIVTRDTDAILDALQARFEARPLDPELQALFKDAARLVSRVFPANSELATAEERAEYVAGMQARLEALPGVFRHAESPASALRNLVICWHCVERLTQARWLDPEQAADLLGQVLGHYALYAPMDDAP